MPRRLEPSERICIKRAMIIDFIFIKVLCISKCMIKKNLLRPRTSRTVVPWSELRQGFVPRLDLRRSIVTCSSSVVSFGSLGYARALRIRSGTLRSIPLRSKSANWAPPSLGFRFYKTIPLFVNVIFFPMTGWNEMIVNGNNRNGK
jgi:hypothetical protein